MSERVRGAELQVSELESVSVSECESLCESLQAESGRECECGNEVSEQEGLCQDPFLCIDFSNVIFMHPFLQFKFM